MLMAMRRDRLEAIWNQSSREEEEESRVSERGERTREEGSTSGSRKDETEENGRRRTVTCRFGKSVREAVVRALWRGRFVRR